MVWPYRTSMATPSIKATYALDVDTVRTLERMARRWRVSKSEALRRAIRVAAQGAASERSDALSALEALQRGLDLTPARARTWAGDVQRERRAAAARRERRAR
jgi:hypothetical protein